jgi:hypothetical protein
VEAAGQTYKAGELVYNSSGVTICGADPALILGIVAKDATGTTSTAAPLFELFPWTKVRIQCYSSAAVALSSSATLYTAYGIVNASNIWYLDLDDTSNDRFVVHKQIVGLDGVYTSWVEGYFLDAYLQTKIGT